MASLVGNLLIVATTSQAALAAPPISKEEAENSFQARSRRAMRTKPPKLLRPRLNIDFAVMLMRTSYNVLDELDCVAMEQFQRDFFLIRQAEYETYIQQLGNGFVQQGDLTDPYYFDFISFAQYTTISRQVSLDPPLLFMEKQPVEVPEGEMQKFQDVVVQRTVATAMLPVEHARRVGTRILTRLDEIYGPSPSALPSFDSRPDASQLQGALQQLVNLFVLNGYALDGNVSVQDASKLSFCLSLRSPANIWSGQALAQERAAVSNTFLLKTATALVERYGFIVSSSNVKYSGTDELNYLTLR